MKLLKKSTIQSDLASQKKQQIDEGVAIARKVDELRLKLANLQVQEKAFLEGMQAEMEKKTGALGREIEARQEEIHILEAEKLELLKPLTAEWDLLSAKTAELEQVKVDLLRVSSDALNKEKRLEDKLKQESETLNRIKVRERELIKVYEDTSQVRTSIENIKEAVIKEKERWDKYYDGKNAELTKREKAITSYEFTLKKRQEELEIKEKEVADEKIKLQDQRQTLERAMARIKKKK
jgi:chromosome segregation ATPase